VEVKKAGYPFRFYGAVPDDWLEGANGGHCYEIRLKTAPDATTRSALVAEYMKLLRKGPVANSSFPFEFSGPYVRLCVGERGTKVDPREFFDSVGAFLKKLHKSFPIEEVNFWGAREDAADPWTQWSLKERSEPMPGPPEGGVKLLFVRDVDPSLPPYAQDKTTLPQAEELRVFREVAAARLKTAKDKWAPVTLRLMPLKAAPEPATAGVVDPAEASRRTSGEVEASAVRFALELPRGRTVIATEDALLYYEGGRKLYSAPSYRSLGGVVLYHGRLLACLGDGIAKLSVVGHREPLIGLKEGRCAAVTLGLFSEPIVEICTDTARQRLFARQADGDWFEVAPLRERYHADFGGPIVEEDDSAAPGETAATPPAATPEVSKEPEGESNEASALAMANAAVAMFHGGKYAEAGPAMTRAVPLVMKHPTPATLGALVRAAEIWASEAYLQDALVAFPGGFVDETLTAAMLSNPKQAWVANLIDVLSRRGAPGLEDRFFALLATQGRYLRRRLVALVDLKDERARAALQSFLDEGPGNVDEMKETVTPIAARLTPEETWELLSPCVIRGRDGEGLPGKAARSLLYALAELTGPLDSRWYDLALSIVGGGEKLSQEARQLLCAKGAEAVVLESLLAHGDGDAPPWLLKHLAGTGDARLRPLAARAFEAARAGPGQLDAAMAHFALNEGAERERALSAIALELPKTASFVYVTAFLERHVRSVDGPLLDAAAQALDALPAGAERNKRLRSVKTLATQSRERPGS
jgi:hypothetical protein